jgi:cyclophilin family peptidyl-prolyl cis-trans isomerase
MRVSRHFGLLVALLLVACPLCLNGQSSPIHTSTKGNHPTMKSTNDHAVIETSMGSMEVELFSTAAPRTVNNFVGLAEKGYYNGVVFHRVIEKFMIQGGDPTGTGRGGESLYGGPFEDEFVDSLKFDRAGILAMANRGPNTNTSQFFITLAPTPWLNGRHTIFGKVVKGMDVLEEIGRVKTDQSGNRPLQDVVITTITVMRAATDSTSQSK